jgi:acetylornithine deacetylase/succinyl-diaminopimelate desuccinylase-like protein
MKNADRIAVLALGSVLAGLSPAGAQDIAYPDVTAEVAVARRVLETARVQRALAYIDRADEETIQEWLSLCNAYAPSAPQTNINDFGPSSNETPRSRLIYKLFRIYGLENVHIDEARNVIGIRRGSGGGPTVVLNAHHDNVALWPAGQPVEAFVADGRIWCPAAGDDLMGVVQLLTVLRALNAADIRTRGDIWFVTFTGEEYGSPGAEHFVTGNYPHNLDWRRGDILVQFHGGGGQGVTTGSTPYSHRSTLRVFAPLDFPRWQPDAVDALGPLLTRLNREVRDPRSTEVGFYATGASGMTSELLYMNIGMVRGNAIHNGTSSEATVRFDLRSPTEERLWSAHQQIRQIADEVMQEMGPGFTYHYSLDMKTGSQGVDGFDKVGSPAVRMAAAAAQALYGGTPVVDASRGCGDCRRAYMFGMPAMSLRGNVIDYGEGGRFEVRPEPRGLRSEVRRKTSGHDVTESAEIVRVWSGAKHGLLFAVAYAGLADEGAAP